MTSENNPESGTANLIFDTGATCGTRRAISAGGAEDGAGEAQLQPGPVAAPGPAPVNEATRWFADRRQAAGAVELLLPSLRVPARQRRPEGGQDSRAVTAGVGCGPAVGVGRGLADRTPYGRGYPL